MLNLDMSKLAPHLRKRAKDRYALVLKTIRVFAKTRAILAIQEEISSSVPQPVDRGTYRRGWTAHDTPHGAVVFNSTKYAGVIERGRRAGAKRPPSDVLVSWVLRKGLVRGVKGKANRAQAAKGLAFVIARKIGRKGLPARNILARAVAKFRPELLAEIKALP